jgi:hypothetical protein
MALRRLSVTGIALLIALAGASLPASPAAPFPYQHFRSRPDLRPPPVKIMKRSRSTTRGFIFIAPKKDVAQAGPLIVDNHGEVVWFSPLGTRSATDFRVQSYRGRPVLTWWRSKSEDGAEASHYSIYDSSYRLIKTVTPPRGLQADIHEFWITNRNSAFMTVYHKVTVKGRPVVEGVVVERDLRTGRVLFEWHSLGHVKLAESYYGLPKNPGTLYDYFHINSVDVDHDGNLLVSARNTHTVYKLDRRTGRIIWRLGGRLSDFTFGRGARFAWQHDARRRPNGTITLFDNNRGKQSRGLVLRLDMKQMRATLVHAYVHRRPPLMSVDQANMQRLPNGHFLIGWGHQPYVSEVGSRGRQLFDLRFGTGSHVDSYRAYRFRWKGRPTRRPDVAVQRGKAYVSWNGATEVRTWQLLAGPRKQALRPVRTVPKRGFETAIRLRVKSGWIAVRALDGRGHWLRRSAAVQVQ